jgi:DNA repair exonuclease SbcCD ATPase subunit
MAMESWDDAEHSGGRDTSRGRGRQGFAPTGIDELKRVLRERVESVTAREHELVEMRARLARRLADLDKTKGSRRDDKQLTERERQLAAREEELEAKLAAAEKREREAASKLALATAEREKLEERERAVKDVERQLAGQRRRLEEERATLPNGEPPPALSEAKPPRDPEPQASQAVTPS